MGILWAYQPTGVRGSECFRTRAVPDGWPGNQPRWGENQSALSAIEQASLTGGAGDNKINASSFTGFVTIDGGAGNESLVGGSGSDSLIGGAGNDSLSGDAGNAGLGNDDLNGGGGSNILVGSTGDDKLIGGKVRDLLIGGTGTDRLVGNDGDDILIGGSTAFDCDYAEFDAMLSEWTSSGDYCNRVANLRGTGSGSSFANRLNGNFFLKTSGPDATVLDDLLLNSSTTNGKVPESVSMCSRTPGFPGSGTRGFGRLHFPV